MKKEKIEKIKEENLDDVSGGMYVGSIHRSYPTTEIDEIILAGERMERRLAEKMKRRSELDKKIARLRELEKEVKNMNGIPTASTLEEMLDLRKYVDSFKEEFYMDSFIEKFKDL